MRETHVYPSSSCIKQAYILTVPFSSNEMLDYILIYIQCILVEFDYVFDINPH